ncbi:hypothetical protein [Paenibacillus sp. DYY-L-2]
MERIYKHIEEYTDNEIEGILTRQEVDEHDNSNVRAMLCLD